MINADTRTETLPPPRPRRVLWAVLGSIAGLIGLAAGVTALWEVPYYTVSPGSVWSTGELVTVDGAESFTSDGEIGFTTVSLSDGPISQLEYFLASIDPAVEIVPARDILGDQTHEENRQRNLQMMNDSQQQATAVAFETLGYEVAVPYGARVSDVDPGFPAAEILSRGDLIVEAQGMPVETWEELVEILTPLSVGDEVTLGVAPAPEDLDEPMVLYEDLDDAEIVTVSAPLAPSDDDPPRAILGILGDTAVTFDFPFDVTIDAGAVGGPSAGLAFTLAVLDALTDEDLTGGELVATTGTIRLDGTVGPVGGVEQKVYAARRAEVDLFLVPRDEFEEAESVGGDMEIVAVDDLDDALVALESIGGQTQALQATGDDQPN